MGSDRRWRAGLSVSVWLDDELIRQDQEFLVITVMTRKDVFAASAPVILKRWPTLNALRCSGECQRARAVARC